MRRHHFYEISPEAYLFSDLVRREDDRKQKEEPVRQWCAFELIRAYGIPINDIVFEYPVKIGSKKYEIDILIRKNEMPWIVVECKEPKNRRHEKAVEQAISYADAQTIGAEFVLYTNGSEWMVKRKIQDDWKSVIDLPKIASLGRTDTLYLVRTIEDLKPILRVLDLPLDRKSAKVLLENLQEFFIGENLINQGTDESLRDALDNILRVISNSDAHVDYQQQKLKAAHCGIERFRQLAGIGLEIDFDAPSPHPTFQNFHSLRIGVALMVENSEGLIGADPLILRLMASVLCAGERLFDPRRRVLELGPSFHHALRAYLAYGLAEYLDLLLPDPVDHASVSDLRNACS